MLRSKPLGQYFTPPPVVDLAFALLQWLTPDLVDGSLLDLSCGEGAFLSGALRAGYALERLYGLDADQRLPAMWRASGLTGPRGPHLAIGDGLLAEGEGRFDAVVGNPPFAGQASLEHLAQLALDYGWWRLSCKRPERLPRELWFLEASLRLLRQGGLLAMVIPEGVLANHRWVRQREALLAENQIEAVVGLPRSVFRGAGTTVKTCLLVVRKRRPAPQHRVRLAELYNEAEIATPETLIAAWSEGRELSEGRPWEPLP